MARRDLTLTIGCIGVPEFEAEAAVFFSCGRAPLREAFTMAAPRPLPSEQHAVWVCVGDVALLDLAQGP